MRWQHKVPRVKHLQTSVKRLVEKASVHGSISKKQPPADLHHLLLTPRVRVKAKAKARIKARCIYLPATARARARTKAKAKPRARARAKAKARERDYNDPQQEPRSSPVAPSDRPAHPSSSVTSVTLWATSNQTAVSGSHYRKMSSISNETPMPPSTN